MNHEATAVDDEESPGACANPRSRAPNGKMKIFPKHPIFRRLVWVIAAFLAVGASLILATCMSIAREIRHAYERIPEAEKSISGTVRTTLVAIDEPWFGSASATRFSLQLLYFAISDRVRFGSHVSVSRSPAGFPVIATHVASHLHRERYGSDSTLRNWRWIVTTDVMPVALSDAQILHLYCHYLFPGESLLQASLDEYDKPPSRLSQDELLWLIARKRHPQLLEEDSQRVVLPGEPTNRDRLQHEYDKLRRMIESKSQ